MRIAMTLWDLIRPQRGQGRTRPEVNGAVDRDPPPPAPAKPRSTRARRPATRPRAGALERYDEVIRIMLDRHRVRVRKWRKHMSGVAWEVRYGNGAVVRLIECPRPRGPVSMSIFLHEIGHHAIGFDRYSPRCLEEFHAWSFALEQMKSHELNITDAVLERVHDSLHYAVDKARRRGLRRLPRELEPYARPRPGRSRRA